MAITHTAPAHVVVVCGPAGSGKSTVAQHLAADLDYVCLEGDDFHTPEAVNKMRSGQPLADADRWDWLIRLREAVVHALQTGAAGVVLSCSALKKKYRDVLRVLAVSRPSRVVLQFVYLQVPQALLLARVQARTNHYMKASMVQSQVASEEPPVAGSAASDHWEDERQDTVVVEAGGDLASVYASVRLAIGQGKTQSSGPTSTATNTTQRPTQASSTIS